MVSGLGLGCHVGSLNPSLTAAQADKTPLAEEFPMQSSGFLLQKVAGDGSSLWAVMRSELDIAHIALRAGPNDRESSINSSLLC